MRNRAAVPAIGARKGREAGRHPIVTGLLPVAEAQARLFALATPLRSEGVPLSEAVDRWAAALVDARRNQPAIALSAMDGYALRFAELPGPWTVIGESKAGAGLDRALGPGEAARIFTGAPLPAGADTILIQEEAARAGDRVSLAGEGPSGVGTHVRGRASDFAVGAPLVRAGERWTAARIALAAMGGHGTVPVRCRPRVTLLSTGDELVLPGAPIADSTLPASNAPMLAAMLHHGGAIVRDGGILPDRLEALAAGFAEAARDADLIVTTGGVSVGDHDLVRPALLRAGASLDFWRVAMRPGKPLMAGRLGRAVVLGLPGNPVSAFVTAMVFGQPLVRHLAGDPSPVPVARRGCLLAPLPPTGLRAEYLRARLSGDDVLPLEGQDSAALAALAAADALICRPAGSKAAARGESVDILPIA